MNLLVALNIAAKIPSDSNNHKIIRPKLRAPKTEMACEANIAPIITKGVNGSTHIISKVKLKNVDFHKKIKCTISITAS